MLRVFFTAEADNSALGALRGFCEITFDGWNVNSRVLGENELIEKLQGIEIFVTSYDKVTRRVIENTNLKLIICARATPTNVDMAAAKENGVAVAFTPGRNSDAIAEFAVGLLLDIARNITFANKAVTDFSVIADEKNQPTEDKKDSAWGETNGLNPHVKFQGPQIKNKNVGVAGFGSIGKRVAKIMEGFGANILVYDPHISRVNTDAPSAVKVGFEGLLEKSDFISCHLPATPETTGIFDMDAFKKMKPTAYIINNSHGEIIKEDDLVKALQEKVIAGAALDVFEYEPLYKGHPLLELDNVLLTPHISGASPDAIINGTHMLVDEILNFMRGEYLLNVK